MAKDKTSSTSVVEKKSTTSKKSAVAAVPEVVVDKKKTTTTTKKVAAAATTVKAATTSSDKKISKNVETKKVEDVSDAIVATDSESAWKNMDITSGGSFIDVHPILASSTDLLVACLNKIYVYNPQTGQVKKQIILKSFISAMCLSKKQKNVVLVSTVGSLLQIEFDSSSSNKTESSKGTSTTASSSTSSEQQYTKPLKDPISLATEIIVHMIVDPSNHDQLYYSTPTGVFRIDLSQTQQPATRLMFISYPRGMVLSDTGRLLAVHSNNVNIQIINLQSGLEKVWTSESVVTSMAFSPRQSILSYGTTTGRINHLSINAQSMKLSITGYDHWHPTPVTALQYSSEGNLLFSGGFESSLVVWTTATMRRNFLPRLGGAINSVSVDPDTGYVAVALKTNCIKVVNVSDLSLSQSIIGVRFGSNTRSLTGLQAHPLTRTIAMNGTDGTIQFYDARQNRVSSELIVSPPANTSISTKQAKTKLKQFDGSNPFDVQNSQVTRLAFHPRFNYLATFEERPGTQNMQANLIVKDQILKFWKPTSESNVISPSDSLYECSFSVTTPHKSPIQSMAFHPKLALLLTGSSTDFKMWQKKDDMWSCVFTGQYRSLPATAAAFSHDGSVFAISAGHLVTVWQLEGFKMLTILAHTTVSLVRSLHFLADATQLLANYESCMAVWDLTRVAPILAIDGPLDSLAVSPDGDRIAISGSLSNDANGNTNYISILNTHSAGENTDSLFTCEHVVMFQSPVKNLLFADEPHQQCLYYTPHNHFICGLSIATDGDASKSAAAAIRLNPNKYSEKMGKNKMLKNHNRNTKQQLADMQEMTEKLKQTQAQKELEKEAAKIVQAEMDMDHMPSVQQVGSAPTNIFNAASHIIPGVQSIYQTFMDSMLTTQAPSTSSSSSSSKHSSSKSSSASTLTNSTPANDSASTSNGPNTPKSNKNYKFNPSSFKTMKGFFDNQSSAASASPATATSASPASAASPSSSSDLSAKRKRDSGSTNEETQDELAKEPKKLAKSSASSDKPAPATASTKSKPSTSTSSSSSSSTSSTASTTKTTTTTSTTSSKAPAASKLKKP
ncbi:hypothetical protein SAMD00019534_076080 [Acytostelium subglobosum LB1]|uniref:hypothetical protein n=1 Tax=Acytostelium subglobosum LB1 TaxID=1410327 RepID=UPI0006451949|nr:hypothetical protein SAMD00019534_076080 [Acytostelium subglobosum LB1]GAM24433.1 hypothetical protein SAMD00019534_076080 [Acytostelium subglobosum LB1]|eukprot:XP_012752759.1 hypothetical protein SAMD00019534_076080 [Acytostelium subglobosum LB1]